MHKRLQMLESNSTLSLQYIEEQSRMLRDAFTKVEKRQLSKTESFLKELNSTVMTELRDFRQQYDQLWQSTVIELADQSEQYQREMVAISTRLSMLTDELVFQKRMIVVQSTLVLLCLGIALFVRSGTSNQLELPIMQQMLNKSQGVLRLPSFDSSPGSPASRRSSSVEGSARDSSPDHRRNPAVRYALPTPEASPSPEPLSRASPEVEDVARAMREVRSGPSTPRGTRDGLEWEDGGASEEDPVRSSDGDLLESADGARRSSPRTREDKVDEVRAEEVATASGHDVQDEGLR